MRRMLLLLACFLLISSLALAQAGTIGVFADPAGCSCDLNNSYGFMQVHVVHGNFTEATGCQFSVAVYGTPLTCVQETSNYTTIGNAPSGVAVAYGSCKTSGVHVMTITYMGISTTCDAMYIEADPTAVPPEIYVTDCATPTPNLLTIPSGGMGHINNDGSCPCRLGSPYPEDCLIPVEKTSWGQVKALYK